MDKERKRERVRRGKEKEGRMSSKRGEEILKEGQRSLSLLHRYLNSIINRYASPSPIQYSILAVFRQGSVMS
jgi:hypothetical protein